MVEGLWKLLRSAFLNPGPAGLNIDIPETAWGLKMVEAFTVRLF
jgi:hypothetical protein